MLRVYYRTDVPLIHFFLSFYFLKRAQDNSRSALIEMIHSPLLILSLILASSEYSVSPCTPSRCVNLSTSRCLYLETS